MAHAHRYHHLDFNVLFQIDFQLRHSLGRGALPQEDEAPFDSLIGCLSFGLLDPRPGC